MTTIAYRDGVMAADTMVNSGGVILGSNRKIVRNKAGELAGGAGAASVIESFLRWFMDGEKKAIWPELTSGPNFTDVVLVVREDGALEVYDGFGMHPITAPYYALGSGEDVAFGALFMGATPFDAVRAAMAHDCRTGGQVDVLILGEKG